jgi:hypothetical protein
LNPAANIPEAVERCALGDLQHDPPGDRRQRRVIREKLLVEQVLRVEIQEKKSAPCSIAAVAVSMEGVP